MYRSVPMDNSSHIAAIQTTTSLESPKHHSQNQSTAGDIGSACLIGTWTDPVEMAASTNESSDGKDMDNHSAQIFNCAIVVAGTD